MEKRENFFSSYSTGLWGFITRTVVTSLAVIFAAWILPGVKINGIWAAIATAIVIGVLDNIVRPAIVVATLPFTVTSMGCFIFCINAFIITLAAWIVPGFKLTEAHPFWTAMLFSILLTLFNYLLELPNRRRLTYDETTKKNDEEHFDDYEDVTDKDTDKM
ncbi:MAG: phage holin family protein [Bacteroidales bacterium]|nr:phage holin family protein [Bacteroidales bacterium]